MLVHISPRGDNGCLDKNYVVRMQQFHGSNRGDSFLRRNAIKRNSNPEVSSFALSWMVDGKNPKLIG